MNGRFSGRLAIGLLAVATSGFAQMSGYPNGQLPSGPQPTTSGSPRPGSVNYVEGQVSANGEELSSHSVGHFSLEPGQSLQTSANGYAEVLLTPGAFLRVGPNSEMQMTSVGLADARVVLTKGNVLLEADQVIGGSHVEVTIGSASADLLKKGLYGFSASPMDAKVFDGKLDVIGQNKSVAIGKGKQVLFANGDNLSQSKFDESQAKNDPLYVWSEARSRSEAAQNKLVSQNPYGYAPAGEGWFWDPYVGYYGFWPSAYLYSPFGFGFYGGYYPGFYGGYYGGFHRGFWNGRHPVVGSARGFSGVHGNGVARGFHGGGGGGRR